MLKTGRELQAKKDYDATLIGQVRNKAYNKTGRTLEDVRASTAGALTGAANAIGHVAGGAAGIISSVAGAGAHVIGTGANLIGRAAEFTGNIIMQIPAGDIVDGFVASAKATKRFAQR